MPSFHNSYAPIAVIGMSLRAPGAESTEAFWENLLEGRDCFTRPTETRLRRAGVPERLIRDPNFIRSRPLLKDPGGFDPAFFDMSVSSAKTTDPCHRLFMTCAWEAMERAGEVPGPGAGVVGVYGGGGGVQESYPVRNFGGGHVDLDDPSVWLPVNLGGGLEHLTSRVCFHFDMKGPNISVSAACATSLLAIHLAVRDLRHGDCDMALAGGATVSTPHWPGYLNVEGGPVSPSGVVRPFDEKADGTVFGSGGGVVVLKRLDDAMADGNAIHAVIRGTGIYNDGGGKSSLAAPGLVGQVAAISRAMEDAGISAGTIGFIESHGTGTLSGDPMEVDAASRVFQKDTDRKQFCALGALKANIGHAAAAAGVLAFIKTCLVLEHGKIPRNIHFETPNPRLDLPSTPFYIPTETVNWDANGQPRRAGVSAFGFGGSNAHVVLEAPPAKPPVSPSDTRGEIIMLSARTSAALDRQTRRLKDHLQEHPDLRLEDVSHTLRFKRKHWEYRAATPATGISDLLGRLGDKAVHGGCVKEAPPVIFAFPGQGSQRAEMGFALYREDRIFREQVDQCAELLVPHLGMDIRDLLCSDSEEAAALIMQTAYSQPGLFILDYALAKRLMADGVQPTAMIGHSLGELVAACLSGVFPLPDVLALVALRGQLMQACHPGSMMAVFESAVAVQPYLINGIEIAAHNAPDSTVVSGSKEAIKALSDTLEAKAVGFRILNTSHAFHSASMEPVVEPFREAVAKLTLSPPGLPFVSNVSGQLIKDSEATDPDYWAKHIRQAVRFTQGVQTLKARAGALWLEVGPGDGLTGLLKRQVEGATLIPVLHGEKQDRLEFLDVLSQLWVEGVGLNGQGRADGSPTERHTVLLPTYPFENESHWIEPPVFQPKDAVAIDEVNETEAEQQLLYSLAWRPEALRTAQPSGEEDWLIFEDETELGVHLRKKLQSAGARVVVLRPGVRFEAIGPDEFQVIPGAVNDLLSVLTEVGKSGGSPRRIVHLWNVDGAVDQDSPAVESFGRFKSKGFDTLLALVQALSQHCPDEEVKVTVVADRLVALEGEDKAICWEKAALLGPCRVTPLETAVEMQLIDIPALVAHEEWLGEGLLAEAWMPEPGTLKVLRPNARFIETVHPLTESLGSRNVKPGGVALITGGMGGLGLAVAGRLHEMAGMRLALLSRWEAPPVAEWEQRRHIDDRVGRALKKVMELQAQGAEVLIVRGDSACLEDMEGVIGQVKAHFGGLDGVVHAAGVSVPKLILESSGDNTAAVFEAKVGGAVILEELLAAEPLEFVIYFSSIASVDPTSGQIDYSAANAMLDALSRRHASPVWDLVCSISWDAWQEVGMAAEDARKRAMNVIPDLASGPVGTVVQHPVWQYKTQEKNRVCFAGLILPSRHWMADEHRKEGGAILPATGILELIHGAHRFLSGGGSPVRIRNVAFRRFVEVPEEGLAAWLFLTFNGDESEFELRSGLPGSGGQRPEAMTLHATGSLLSLTEPPAFAAQPDGEFEAVAVSRHGIMQFGPRWMTIRQEVGGEHGCVRKFSLAEEFAGETAEYGLHPALLDRAIGFLSSEQLNREGVPSLIGELRVYKSMPASVTVIAQAVPGIEGSSSLTLVNDSGEVIMEVDEYQQVPISERGPAHEPEDLRLALGVVGDLNSLKRIPFDPPPPAAGEVQVEVYAAGLNFRDVLTCLGGLSEVEPEGAPPGGECSGRVVAVGPGVEEFSVGDPVVTIARGAFSTKLNADERIVAPKPGCLSFEEAASVPITFLTAEYALNHLGRIRQGERVLIHAGAGGVGLAAIQIAKIAGAEVYATAGSEEKRAYLRDLGVNHVSDSRSLDFAEAIRGTTHGEGVDLVLNSLAGDFIHAGLELLRPYGRFLEIGKRDIYQNSPIGMFPFRNNLSFHGIDLSPMIQEKHPVLVKMFADLMESFSQRALKPGPVLSVPWEDTRRAMEHMAAARHIGKVVLEVRAPALRSKDHLSADEIFKRRYARSITMKNGLDVFQEILQGTDVPPHVIVSPRLSDGKVARPQAPTLLDRGGTDLKRSGSVEYQAPSTPVEESVVRVWREVFSTDSIGVNDDFLELGGDSISSIQILNRIRKALGAKLPNDALFRFSTPAQLSVCIESTFKSKVE